MFLPTFEIHKIFKLIHKKRLSTIRQSLFSPLFIMNSVRFPFGCFNFWLFSRISESNDGMRYDCFRKSKYLCLCFYTVHLGPGSHPDAADSQVFCRKNHILCRNTAVNYPILLCRRKGSFYIATDQNSKCCIAKRFCRSSIGICHFIQCFLILYHKKSPVSGVHTGRPTHPGFQNFPDIIVIHLLIGISANTGSAHNRF